jgi:predicted FMN-binding regulatory protein PaiB
MVGRFKLSQDRDDADRAAAARALIRRSEAGEAGLINEVCGLEVRSPAAR